MSPKAFALIFCLGLSTAAGSVVPSDRHSTIDAKQDETFPIKSSQRNAKQRREEMVNDYSELQTKSYAEYSALRGSVADLHFLADGSEKGGLAPAVKGSCKYMLCILCVLCCCGPVIKEMFGEHGGSACMMVTIWSMVFYVLFSGIWDSWKKGEHVGLPCTLVCLWVLLLLCLVSCYVCLICGFFGAALGAQYIIQNDRIKKMNEAYENKKGELSGPRREYFDSPVFKERCDKMFDKYDKDHSGEMDMEELTDAISKELHSTEEDAAAIAPIFKMGVGSSVHKEEFVYLMQYFSMLKFQEGQMNEDIAYEVLQLDPETATYEDFKKSYKDMSRKYHPDIRKRKEPGLPEDVYKRDSAEVNDAKAILEKLPKFSSKD